MLHRQRFQHNAIQQAEDRGIRANPQRERQDGHRRECRRPPQRAQTVAQILHELLQPFERPHLARLLRDPRRIAEFPARPVACFRLGNSRLDQLIDALAQMRFDLLRHVSLHLPAAPRVPAHDSAPLIARVMPRIIRSNADTFWSSCFRPSRVIR